MELEDYKELFDKAPCGYISAAPDGRIIQVNQTLAEWVGHAHEELVGRRFQDLLNIAGKIYYETHFAPLLKMQGFFNEVALDIVRKDGSTLSTLVNAAERREESGVARFILITIFNATDRRRYEKQVLEARNAAEHMSVELRELNQSLEMKVSEAVDDRLKAEEVLRQSQKMDAIGQLTGGIAHDFNNMLAVVIAALNLIERRHAKGQPFGQFIASAQEASRRAADLTHRLLAFSRQLPLNPQSVDVGGMVKSMSEILRRTLGEEVRLETVLAGGLWRAKTDTNQLENAILNLSINARDAMPNGGKLTIETSNALLDDDYARANQEVTAGQYVLIAVSDTGTGMSQETIRKAFEPFFTTKAAGKGTGLGLSQVFGYVKQSRGHVKIYSELGHGTTVKIYLPRSYEAIVDTPQAKSAVTPAGSQDEVILLVEDEDKMREMSAAALQELGYTVIHTSSGAQALEILKGRPEVSLLFTDIVMPDMGGRQLADQASKLRPGLRILYTTGYTRNAIVHNGVLDPSVNFLQKPFTLDQLGKKVREVLSQ